MSRVIQVLTLGVLFGLWACAGAGPEATGIISGALDAPADLAPGGAAAGPIQSEGTLGANYDPNPKAFNKKKTSNHSVDAPEAGMADTTGQLQPANSPNQDYLNSKGNEDEDEGYTGAPISIPQHK